MTGSEQGEPPAAASHWEAAGVASPDQRARPNGGEAAGVASPDQHAGAAGGRSPDVVAPLPPGSLKALLNSFGYAAQGVWMLVRTQRNAQIHVALAALALIMGALLRISHGEWLALLILIGLVLGAEGLNTAIEAAVDLASPGYHPLAKRAKDVAAGAVLIIAVVALFVGALIFLPHLYALLF